MCTIKSDICSCSAVKVVGIRVGVTPHHSTEKLADIRYYLDATAADEKDISICKQLIQALTGSSVSDATAVPADDKDKQAADEQS